MLSLVVAGPLLKPGYLLLRDAVSTPRSYLSDAALGLSASAPRALPQDFAVALASHVIDGGIVVKVLLVAGLWLAGWGSARLVAAVLPDAGAPGQLVAATLAVWNPYVAERLLQGHWSLLVGYGCLPWVAATVLAMRTSGGPLRFEICALVFWTALAGLTPTGLMLAATVALVCSSAPGSGRSRTLCATVGVGAAFFAALPWLTAAFVAGSLSSSQADGVRAFAPRAEPGLATLGSLASLGGIWNGDAVPSSRTTLFAVVAAVVLLGVVAAGLPVVIRTPTAIPLLVLAAAAVVIPALMATVPRAGGGGVDGAGDAGARGGPRCAEVGGVGGAGLHARRGGRGADPAAVGACFRRGGRLQPRLDRDAARSRVGCRRQGRRGRVSGGLGGGRGDHQRRPASGRGAADGQHAELRLGGRCAGARPAAALGARRCADDRRPDDLGARGTR